MFRAWLAFFLVSLAWGTSFYWIKIALRELSPGMIVSLRLSVATVALGIIVFLSRIPLTSLKRRWSKVFLVSLFNPVLPFLLITWAETKIDTGLTSILNGAVPLFALVVAHLFFPDERITPRKVLGLSLGLLGIGVLFSERVSFSIHAVADLSGHFAVILACLFYAITGMMVKKYLREVPPLITTLSNMIVSCVFAWLGVVVFAETLTLPRSPMTWAAIGWLGLVGTAGAYTLYYYLIGVWGSSRAALVNFAYPVMAVMMGSLFLGEHFKIRYLIGAAFIFLGIFFVSNPRIKTFRIDS